MRHIPESEYRPLISEYLAAGYRVDDLLFNRVVLDDNRILGSVRVSQFFMPGDGEFHLATMMGMIWLSQLGVIYSCLDNGLTRKSHELYMREFRVRCRDRIVELNDILLELIVTGKRATGDTILYTADFDIDVGSFTGSVTWIMPALPPQT